MSQTDAEFVEIEPLESETTDEESTPVEFEINTFPADFTLEVLHQKWQNHDFVIPDFQRKFVWKKSQSSRLIESFMMGLPVPQVFLYVDKDEKLLIIDGQQRLRSVFYFFEGYWGEPDTRDRREVFKLGELNEKSKWFNKSFEDFDDSDRRKLKNALLRAILVKQLDPKDDTSIYHVFERLNTGGTLLKPQEVRNCVYFGKLTKLLSDLNATAAWRNILGKPLPDIHLKDVELILRYMALYHWAEKYEKPMKDFLSKFMNKHRNPSDQFLADERSRFERTCKVVVTALGERPFSPRGPLNSAVYECVFLAFARHGETYPNDVKERYERLKSNPSFRDLTTSATTDVDTVRKRAEMAENELFR
ncbi:MAG: DUF262 domain-containing protein [Candidatus Bathyarchaeia archaeon]|jgi:hypothetical protein